MPMKPAKDWWARSRLNRLGSILYPSLADEATRREMTEIARREGKRPPASPTLLKDNARAAVSPLGGKAKSTIAMSPPRCAVLP